jgi:hypothetical protein
MATLKNKQEDIMKKILILGSGAGLTMVAANLRKRLSTREWDITHYRQR